MSSFIVTRRSLQFATSLVIAGLFLGCSGTNSSKTVTSTVTGSVKFKDKIVNYGSVTFINAEGQQKKVSIASDGTYKMANPPKGKVKVVVKTGALPPKVAAAGADSSNAPKIETIELPSSYSDPEKTKLEFSVTEGDQVYNINIPSEPGQPTSGKSEQPKK